MSSLVAPAIGAVGYYSELFIYDQNGLVWPELVHIAPSDQVRSPGHDKWVPPGFFLKYRPTYLRAELRILSPQQRRRIEESMEEEGRPYRRRLIPLSPADGFPRNGVLVVVERADL